MILGFLVIFSLSMCLQVVFLLSGRFFRVFIARFLYINFDIKEALSKCCLLRGDEQDDSEFCIA